MNIEGDLPAEPIDTFRGIPEDLLTPSQWVDRHRPSYLMPEQRLMFAVLEDAIRALERGRRKYEVEARAWVAGGGKPRISFDYVCEVLALDADWLRKGLLRLDAEGTLKLKRRSTSSGYDSVIPFQRLSGHGRSLRAMSPNRQRAHSRSFAGA